MATDAQIDANRRNAARSTGPKTEKGKARLNALKHGLRAKAADIMPVLPHEDPRELEERIQTWIDDWQPRNALESELVRRGARLSWMLERGERYEAAHLAHRVRRAERKAGPGVSPRRMKKVNDLGRKLFYEYQPGSRSLPGTTWDDEPAVFVAGLEATTDGCRWLLDRWGEIRALLARDTAWLPVDAYWFIRLLGKYGYEAIHDPALNALYLAWETFDKKGAAELLWWASRGRMPKRDPAKRDFTVWRELAPRPADKAAARELLRAVIDERVERLEQIVAELEQTAEAEAAAERADRADRAAFDPSPGFERHRRSQAAMGRELLRTVETLWRLRKVEVGQSVDDDEGLPTGASAGAPPTRPPGEGESQGMCSPRGWGGGSQSETTPQESQGPLTGASASTPPTQPRGEIDTISVERELGEHENATIKANPQSTRESMAMEVTSTCESVDEDDQSQSVAAQGDFSWNKIPILSRSGERLPDHDGNGILSHEVETKDRE